MLPLVATTRAREKAIWRKGTKNEGIMQQNGQEQQEPRSLQQETEVVPRANPVKA
jgi:hypothetical protein